VRAIACLLALGAAGLGRDTVRVLFVGNSHTYVNDVPGMVESLALSGGRLALADMSAPGGFTLEQHTTLQQTLDRIAQDSWDFVVLQEQSQLPTIHSYRFGSMYPAARLLDSLIHAHAESTMFFMTWGWRDGGTMHFGGDSSPPFRDYFHMQDSVAAAYRMIAAELGARLSPVGLAWARARRLDSLIGLWQDDRCHATLEGSYLAACVFYAVLFEADPTGLSFTAGLAADTALFLQAVAWQTAGAAEVRPAAPVPRLTATPNPCRDRVSLQCPPLARTVAIRDRAGRLVRQSPVPGPRAPVTLDLGNVPAGVYFATAGPQTVRFVRVD